MSIICMRSALVTVEFDHEAPKIVVTSVERAEWPDDLDFIVTSNKIIASRMYSFVDDAGVTYRLGYESLDGYSDRVVCPSVQLAQGRGVFFVTIRDEIGNEARCQHQVAIVAPLPFDIVVQMQQIYMVVDEHQPIFGIATSSEEG